MLVAYTWPSCAWTEAMHMCSSFVELTSLEKGMILCAHMLAVSGGMQLPLGDYKQGAFLHA
eukprot:2645126-Rhodomonas_salina.1